MRPPFARLRASSSLAFCLASGLALTTLSCSLPARQHAHEALPRRMPSPERHRVAQVGFGEQSAFAVCAGAACPRATPKTLAIKAPQRVASAELGQSAAGAQRPDEIAHELTVTFAFASANLTPAAKALLSRSIRFAREAGSIVISGRTDSIGAANANEALARARAGAVHHYLRGLAPDLKATISIDAKGRCCFVASNDDEPGRAKNRRVDVVFNGLRGA